MLWAGPAPFLTLLFYQNHCSWKLSFLLNLETHAITSWGNCLTMNWRQFTGMGYSSLRWPGKLVMATLIIFPHKPPHHPFGSLSLHIRNYFHALSSLLKSKIPEARSYVWLGFTPSVAPNTRALPRTSADGSPITEQPLWPSTDSV